MSEGRTIRESMSDWLDTIDHKISGYRLEYGFTVFNCLPYRDRERNFGFIPMPEGRVTLLLCRSAQDEIGCEIFEPFQRVNAFADLDAACAWVIAHYGEEPMVPPKEAEA